MCVSACVCGLWLGARTRDVSPIWGFSAKRTREAPPESENRRGRRPVILHVLFCQTGICEPPRPFPLFSVSLFTFHPRLSSRPDRCLFAPYHCGRTSTPQNSVERYPDPSVRLDRLSPSPVGSSPGRTHDSGWGQDLPSMWVIEYTDDTGRTLRKDSRR